MTFCGKVMHRLNFICGYLSRHGAGQFTGKLTAATHVTLAAIPARRLAKILEDYPLPAIRPCGKFHDLIQSRNILLLTSRKELLEFRGQFTNITGSIQQAIPLPQPRWPDQDVTGFLQVTYHPAHLTRFFPNPPGNLCYRQH